MSGQVVHLVPITCLRFGLSPRMQGCDPDHASALAEVLDDVPPILVHGPTMRVVDGVHRVHAARAAGRATIRALMFNGDEAAMLIEAVRSNVAHGKPLTCEERQEAALRILSMRSEWSDRRVAEVSGLAPKTVARLRARASAVGAQSRARLGRDGRLRPLDPAEVRQRVVEALSEHPEASNRAISRLTGASQATVRDVRARVGRGESGLLPCKPRQAEGDSGDFLLVDAHASTMPPTVCSEFTEWFSHGQIDLVDWKPFVDALPVNAVYIVADECRRRSDNWRAFAAALEARARTHRRSRQRISGHASHYS